MHNEDQRPNINTTKVELVGLRSELKDRDFSEAEKTIEKIRNLLSGSEFASMRSQIELAMNKLVSSIIEFKIGSAIEKAGRGETIVGMKYVIRAGDKEAELTGDGMTTLAGIITRNRSDFLKNNFSEDVIDRIFGSIKKSGHDIAYEVGYDNKGNLDNKAVLEFDVDTGTLLRTGTMHASSMDHTHIHNVHNVTEINEHRVTGDALAMVVAAAALKEKITDMKITDMSETIRFMDNGRILAIAKLKTDGNGNFSLKVTHMDGKPVSIIQFTIDADKISDIATKYERLGKGESVVYATADGQVVIMSNTDGFKIAVTHALSGAALEAINLLAANISARIKSAPISLKLKERIEAIIGDLNGYISAGSRVSPENAAKLLESLNAIAGLIAAQRGAVKPTTEDVEIQFKVLDGIVRDVRQGAVVTTTTTTGTGAVSTTGIKEAATDTGIFSAKKIADDIYQYNAAPGATMDRTIKGQKMEKLPMVKRENTQNFIIVDMNIPDADRVVRLNRMISGDNRTVIEIPKNDNNPNIKTIVDEILTKSAAKPDAVRVFAFLGPNRDNVVVGLVGADGLKKIDIMISIMSKETTWRGALTSYARALPEGSSKRGKITIITAVASDILRGLAKDDKPIEFKAPEREDVQRQADTEFLSDLEADLAY